ncbi:Pimeloyl-ACP methyl ester carboxylesterase [Granulicatella balaenopterae]|uniref:Pimeloyl-ACP methyl ester carboxylesterase n=1 Tax=Granulicatella balaenopterae TaxID=137733 RepID=A0A1H9HFC4_9LACT|nr:alpha/beta hydrolase [Granulicatella balaenopterae]SEQ60916.1 Pimeloyl-ACP methyl ester carboxylesterase [Granulicatella balaenopterae]
MYFAYQGKRKMNYEVHGEGKPLVILNGLMMSTKSWEPFLEELTRYNQVILVDFLDQGQSERITDIEYSHDIHVDSLHDLLQFLELEKVSIFGVSYGGEVALQFALRYPNMTDKLLLFNTAAKTSYWFTELGNSWASALGDPLRYYLAAIPSVYSPKFFDEHEEWVEAHKEKLVEVFVDPMFIDSMKRLINSSQGYDVSNRLGDITAPTLIVASEYDHVTPYYEQKYLHKHIKNSELVYLPDSGHALLFEHPNLMISLMLGFLLTEHHDYKL